ncbi:MAG: Xaa-Pro peptidase family protein [Candidatus Omnitrophota bacterium]
MENQRILKVRGFLRRHGFDAFLITSLANIRYLSGFTGGDCYILLTKTENIFIGDFRYTLQAEKELDKSFRIEMIKNGLSSLLKEFISGKKLHSLCFEDKHITVSFFNRIKKSLPKIHLIPTSNVIEKQRIIKTDKEIALISKAVDITKQALNKLKPFIKPGITEIWIKNKLDYLLKSFGGQQPSFDIIVASGPNGAMPHAGTTTRQIQKNEPIIVDVGTVFEGYKSDLTRTFFSGKMTQYAHYYKLIAAAQKKAISLIRPSVKIRDIDLAARNYLKRNKVDKYFGHALGHGVGLEVHEEPRIYWKNSQRLKPGMVFTVEPGIYIPEWGGIRIEDMVLVTKKGCKVL